jgi:hypothetical protein
MDHIVAGRYELLALGHDAAQSLPHQIIWTSRDGLHWRRVATNPFGILTQTPSITALGSGFVALVQYDNEPALWWSANGSRWAEVAGADVFGGGVTMISSAVPWRNGLLVVGQTARPPVVTSTPHPIIGKPTAWLWTPGAPTPPHPHWAAADPLWFRLRLADLGPRNVPLPAGYGFIPLDAFYGMPCPTLVPDPDHLSARCKREQALLGGSLAYGFTFGLSSSSYGPEVIGFAILARNAAQARAAYSWGGGLVIAGHVTVTEDGVPQPQGNVRMAQGGTLYSIQTQHFGTTYAVVWRAGRALGEVEVVGVPGDVKARAVALARVQWHHWQAVGR